MGLRTFRGTALPGGVFVAENSGRTPGRSPAPRKVLRLDADPTILAINTVQKILTSYSPPQRLRLRRDCLWHLLFLCSQRDSGDRLYVGQPIELRRPDGTVICTTIFEVGNNPFCRTIYLSHLILQSDVPPGTEVWCDLATALIV